MNTRCKLSELKKGERALIIHVGPPDGQVGPPDGGQGEQNSEILASLLEMGFLEGSEIEVVHEAPFGRDPLAVRVRGALIAVRRREASGILVERLAA